MFFRRLLLAPLLLGATIWAGNVSKPKNIIFILTDDQDLHMNSLDYMPLLKKNLIEQGTSYMNHFCTIALCCPSRVSLLTGRAAHNTNVTDVVPPYGGYAGFIDKGWNNDYVPLWLQDVGYNTYYVGKFLNYHTIVNYNQPFAAGWTSNDFLLEPGTYQYYNSTWQRDHDAPVSMPGQYSTDIARNKSIAYLHEAAAAGKPFFLTIAPIAPHSTVLFPEGYIENSGAVNYNKTVVIGGDISNSPPLGAQRHQDLFSDAVVPRTPDFNPDRHSGVSWVSQWPQQNQSVVDYGDNWYRERLRALQSVDELVDSVVLTLDQLGILHDTYIMYTTDNGYHIGQHRLPPGKQCGFETDINVPMIVRGPDVPRNKTTTDVTTHTDFAPTWLNIARAPTREGLDGIAMPLTEEEMLADGESGEISSSSRPEHANIEIWGFLSPEGKYGLVDTFKNSTNLALLSEVSFKGARIYGDGFNVMYTVYCNNQRELYNIDIDPYEMNNLVPGGNMTTLLEQGSNATTTAAAGIDGYPAFKIVQRLDSLLIVLKTCKGETCARPWSAIFPSGKVQSLRQALNSKYDAFFDKAFDTNRVTFDTCMQGQILANEIPLTPLIYQQSLKLHAVM